MSNEMSAALIKHLEEEYEDIMSYASLVEKAETEGRKELAMYLYMIWKDEKSHAEFIEDFLEDHKIPLTSKIIELKNKVKG